jgi:hypothetical protein
MGLGKPKTAVSRRVIALARRGRQLSHLVAPIWASKVESCNRQGGLHRSSYGRGERRATVGAHGAGLPGRAGSRPRTRRTAITTNINNEKTVAKCTQRIDALGTYATAGKMTVHGASVTEAQATAVYQACLDTRKQLTSLRGQVAAALAARRAADAAMTAFDAGLQAWVETTYGPTSEAAVDFGYAKKPAVKPTVAAKAAAVQKAQATRKVRGTLGPKARQKVTAEAPVAPPAAAPTATK